jgi:ElaB/YqjD/DUF883 family membrane-anchored ribosome-binding protein
MSHQSTDNLRRDVQALIHDAQNLFHDASNVGGDSAEELRRKGVSLARQALDGLRTLEQETLAKGKQIATDTNRYVHDNPWYAAGISAGVGILIGWLMSQRK